jgi:internalin A
MKFLTIGLLAIATLFNISAFAACPTANVTLTTQTEVDDFATTYPGCTVWPVGIKLRITGNGITNLDGLSVLTQLDGKVKVTLTPDLVDITGLMNVTTINSELQFEECIALASLDGLQNVTTCFRLEIQGMNALTDISQLSGITSLGSSLAILDCDTLTSLNGLQNITSVGGDLRIEQSHLLDDLTALSTLTSVGGSVKILSNKNLTTLDGLDNIVSIGGGLDVKTNPSLADCIGACRMLNVPPPGGSFFSGNLSLQCNDLFVLEADCLIALPVELSGFRAKEDTKNQNVAVSWITASELNNKHFEVQRAADGRNFEVIGIVAGNGTTTKVNNYNFVDQRPIATAYYRLKQVDFSGEFTYSDLVLVKMSKAEDAEVTAYPTIANGEITVRFTGFKALQGTFNVFNTQGKLVHSEEVDLSNKMAYKTLNTSKFQTGIYTIVISDNSNHISTNFIVVK